MARLAEPAGAATPTQPPLQSRELAGGSQGPHADQGRAAENTGRAEGGQSACLCLL